MASGSCTIYSYRVAPLRPFIPLLNIIVIWSGKGATTWTWSYASPSGREARTGLLSHLWQEEKKQVALVVALIWNAYIKVPRCQNCWVTYTHRKLCFTFLEAATLKLECQHGWVLASHLLCYKGLTYCIFILWKDSDLALWPLLRQWSCLWDPLM